jgi:copper homeostasis protein (lipoprotein)
VGDEPVSLGNRTWTAVEVGGSAIERDTAPTLEFDLEESRVAGSGGLNRLMGTFSLSEDELHFGPLATTLMAGPEGAMQRERAFLDALARVTAYELAGRSLGLYAGDDVVARFEC